MSNLQTLIVTLPWPDKVLSPNARVHWAVRAKAAKAAKMLAYAETLRLLKGRQFKAASYYILGLVPDHRRRDRDNLTSSTKAHLDGIAFALCQDDSEWNFTGAGFVQIGKGNEKKICIQLEAKE